MAHNPGFLKLVNDAKSRVQEIDLAKPKAGESEADVILDDAKKNDQVTRKDVSDCIGQWDPQTQMSKTEWANSCRTTLEYFPEGGNN